MNRFSDVLPLCIKAKMDPCLTTISLYHLPGLSSFFILWDGAIVFGLLSGVRSRNTRLYDQESTKHDLGEI